MTPTQDCTRFWRLNLIAEVSHAALHHWPKSQQRKKITRTEARGLYFKHVPINILARRGSRDGGAGQHNFEPDKGTKRQKQSIYCNKWKSKLGLKLQFKNPLSLLFFFSHICRCPWHGSLFLRHFFFPGSQLPPSTSHKIPQEILQVNHIKGKSIREFSGDTDDLQNLWPIDFDSAPSFLLHSSEIKSSPCC